MTFSHNTTANPSPNFRHLKRIMTEFPSNGQQTAWSEQDKQPGLRAMCSFWGRFLVYRGVLFSTESRKSRHTFLTAIAKVFFLLREDCRAYRKTPDPVIWAVSWLVFFSLQIFDKKAVCPNKLCFVQLTNVFFKTFFVIKRLFDIAH